MKAKMPRLPFSARRTVRTAHCGHLWLPLPLPTCARRRRARCSGTATAVSLLIRRRHTTTGNRAAQAGQHGLRHPGGCRHHACLRLVHGVVASARAARRPPLIAWRHTDRMPAPPPAPPRQLSVPLDAINDKRSFYSECFAVGALEGWCGRAQATRPPAHSSSSTAAVCLTPHTLALPAGGCASNGRRSIWASSCSGRRLSWGCCPRPRAQSLWSTSGGAGRSREVRRKGREGTGGRVGRRARVAGITALR